MCGRFMGVPMDALGCPWMPWAALVCFLGRSHKVATCQQLTGTAPPCYRVLHWEVNCDALSMALKEGGHRGNATLGNGLARALTPFIYPLAVQRNP